ncbi:Ubiquitin-conjugating enzyme [Orobanche hederae]
MDAADIVVEIPPPIHLLKKKKQNKKRCRRAILHDVIDIDDDDAGGSEEDLVIIGEKINKKGRKTDESIHQVLAIVQDVIAIDDSDDSDDLVIIGKKVSKSNNGKTNLSSSPLLFETALSKKKSAGSQRIGCGLNLSVGGVESSKSNTFGSTHCDFAGKSEARNLLPASAIKFMKHSAASSRSHNEIMSKFRNFKQFDFVTDASNHHFIHKQSSMAQHSKNWVKGIQKEWMILEKDLPDSIFVRVYESRMDLLSAVIVGAEGTPYHNGLFLFDFYFPRDYPIVPPRVYSPSALTQLHPVFESDGSLCLSLLNTAMGYEENEYWLPCVSTILQVLVSIQGLVLTANPLSVGDHSAVVGSVPSLLYNMNAFAFSLVRMCDTMRMPPRNFEDLVVGHFVGRAHDILRACNAFLEGARQSRSVIKDEAAELSRLVRLNLFSKAMCVDRVLSIYERCCYRAF